MDWDVLAGRVAPALVEEVQRGRHDLLMRAHSRDVVSRGPRELRDVDVQLFRMCQCPVWAAGYGVPSRSPRIVAAVRRSPEEGPDDPRDATIVEVACRTDGAARVPMSTHVANTNRNSSDGG